MLVAPPASGARPRELTDEAGSFISLEIDASMRESGFEDDYEACYEAKLDHASNRGLWQLLSTAMELVGKIPGGVGFAITRATSPLLKYRSAMLDCEEQIMDNAMNDPEYKGSPEYNKLLNMCVKVSGMALIGLEGDESIRTVADIIELLLEHVLHDVNLAEHATEMSGEAVAKEAIGVVLTPLIAILAVKEMLGNAMLLRTQWAYEQVQAAVECLNAGAQSKSESLLTVLRLTREIQDTIASHLIPDLANMRANTFRMRAAWEIVGRNGAATTFKKAYPIIKAQVEDFLDYMTKGVNTTVHALNRLSESGTRRMDEVRNIMKFDLSVSTQLQEEKERKIRQIEIFKSPITWLRGKIPETEPAGHTGSAKERAHALADEHISGSQDLRLLAQERLQDLEGTPTTLDIPVDDVSDLDSIQHIQLEVMKKVQNYSADIATYQTEIGEKIRQASVALDQAIALQGHASEKLAPACVGEQVPDCTKHYWMMGKENGGCDKFWYKVATKGLPLSQFPAYQCQSPKITYTCQPKGPLGGLVQCNSR
jgi:hypothetical protein